MTEQQMNVDASRRRSRRRGQSLVELALVLPLLLLLVAAVADFARAFNSYIVITNAAREGARVGARVNHTSTIDDYILAAVRREAANSSVDLSTEAEGNGDAKITIEPAWDQRMAKEPITVTVEYSMTTIFTGLVGLDTIPMRSGSVMVMLAGTADPPVE